MSHGEIVVKFLGRGANRGGAPVFLRQFPGGVPRWGRCRFDFSPECARYDWLVIYDDLPSLSGERFSRRREPLECPPQHTLLITAEPSSIKTYGAAYLRQFRHVLSSQEPDFIRHPRHLHSQCGLPWFYGRGRERLVTFDQMVGSPPLAKSKDLSTVCSAKRQKHTLHAARFDFTHELRARLPELELFGHGIRDLDDKAEALDDFRYHVAIENHVARHHWTEKLSDAFLGCALPFYFGCPNTDDYFPPESVIHIDLADPAGAAEVIRDAIATKQYEKRLPAILEARRRVLHEYNLFAVTARVVEALHAASAQPQPGRFLLSRRQARSAHPVLALWELSGRASMRIRSLLAPRRG